MSRDLRRRERSTVARRAGRDGDVTWRPPARLTARTVTATGATNDKRGGITPGPRHRAARWLALTLVAGVIGGCSTSTPTGTPAPTNASPTATPPSPSPVASPSTAAVEPTPSPVGTPALSCAARTLASLTEAQRIGQLFIIGLIKNRLDASERGGVANYHFGSMTFTTQSSAGVAAIRALTDAVQAQATPEATARVEFLVAANQEGGLI